MRADDPFPEALLALRLRGLLWRRLRGPLAANGARIATYTAAFVFFPAVFSLKFLPAAFVAIHLAHVAGAFHEGLLERTRVAWRDARHEGARARLAGSSSAFAALVALAMTGGAAAVAALSGSLLIGALIALPLVAQAATSLVKGAYVATSARRRVPRASLAIAGPELAGFAVTLLLYRSLGPMAYAWGLAVSELARTLVLWRVVRRTARARLESPARPVWSDALFGVRAHGVAALGYASHALVSLGLVLVAWRAGEPVLAVILHVASPWLALAGAPFHGIAQDLVRKLDGTTLPVTRPLLARLALLAPFGGAALGAAAAAALAPGLPSAIRPLLGWLVVLGAGRALAGWTAAWLEPLRRYDWLAAYSVVWVAAVLAGDALVAPTWFGREIAILAGATLGVGAAAAALFLALPGSAHSRAPRSPLGELAIHADRGGRLARLVLAADDRAPFESRHLALRAPLGAVLRDGVVWMAIADTERPADLVRAWSGRIATLALDPPRPIALAGGPPRPVALAGGPPRPFALAGGPQAILGFGALRQLAASLDRAENGALLEALRDRAGGRLASRRRFLASLRPTFAAGRLAGVAVAASIVASKSPDR